MESDRDRCIQKMRALINNELSTCSCFHKKVTKSAVIATLFRYLLL